VVRSLKIMLPHWIYWLLLVLICSYAFWRGRSDERVAAATCLLATLIQLLVVSPITRRYSGVELGVLFVDLGVLAVFVAIALQSSRFWPLWIAGLQLTTILGHVMKAVQLDLLPYAYAGALRFWSYPILLVLAVGTWRSNRGAAADRQEAVRT
jgi:hypothetical protein